MESLENTFAKKNKKKSRQFLIACQQISQPLSETFHFLHEKFAFFLFMHAAYNQVMKTHIKT